MMCLDGHNMCKIIVLPNIFFKLSDTGQMVIFSDLLADNIDHFVLLPGCKLQPSDAYSLFSRLQF